MEPHQKISSPCPLCEEETLEVLTWPGHTAIRTSRSAVAKSTRRQRKPEGFVLLSDTCSSCGKTKGEIGRAWKEGIPKKVDYKKRIEELRKAGLAINRIP